MTNASARFRVLAAAGVVGLAAAPMLAGTAYAADPTVEVTNKPDVDTCTLQVALHDFPEGTVPLSVAAEGDTDVSDFSYAMALETETGGTEPTTTDVTILPQEEAPEVITLSVRAGDEASAPVAVNCDDGGTVEAALTTDDAADDQAPAENQNDVPASPEPTEEATVPATVNSGIGGDSTGGLVALGVGGLAVVTLGALGLRKRSA